MTLRLDQGEWIAALRTAYASGHRRVLGLMPTGGGKTHCAAHLSHNAVQSGRRVLFVAPLREIVTDTAKRFQSAGIYTGLIMADEPVEPIARAQVASVQTLVARFRRHGAKWLPAADLVIIDEAHHGVAETWSEIAAQYPNAQHLLLTATPEGSGGRTLGPIADKIVEGPSLRMLTTIGALVQYTLLAPPTLLDGELVIDPVDAVANERDRRAIVFCRSVGHAQDVATRLIARGVAAECIVGDTDKATRDGVRARIHSWITRALVVCGVALEGFDCPSLDHVVLAAPFSTLGRFRQAIGRGLRSCPSTGKKDLLVHDLMGAVHAHGLPDEDVRWSLEGDAAVVRTEKLPGIARCAPCGAMFRPGVARCPRCGAAPEHRVLIPRVLHRAEVIERVSHLPQAERDRRYMEGLLRKPIAQRMPQFRAQQWAHERFVKRFGRAPGAPVVAATGSDGR